GSSSVAYISVTNTGSQKDSFYLYGSFPGGQGSILSLAQYLKNVPATSTATTTDNVAYFCEAGWQAATSSAASSTPVSYSCPATGEMYQCSWLNASSTNCEVPNITV